MSLHKENHATSSPSLLLTSFHCSSKYCQLRKSRLFYLCLLFLLENMKSSAMLFWCWGGAHRELVNLPKIGSVVTFKFMNSDKLIHQIHLEYLAFCTLSPVLLHSHFTLQRIPDILQTQAQLPYVMYYTKKQRSFKENWTTGLEGNSWIMKSSNHIIKFLYNFSTSLSTIGSLDQSC